MANAFLYKRQSSSVRRLLSKLYRIGQYVGSGVQYKTLRESLTNAVSAPLRRLKYISQSAIRDSQLYLPVSAPLRRLKYISQSAIRNSKLPILTNITNQTNHTNQTNQNRNSKSDVPSLSSALRNSQFEIRTLQCLSQQIQQTEPTKQIKPMTNNVAIKVEGLSKRYRIGQYVGSGAQYKTLRESLTNAVSTPLRRLRRNPQSAIRNPQSPAFLWALKDVSFEVKQGEIIGIIGRNGAGKSTLLKILTRITEPTEGRAVLNGRVNSLLEVGTGFHPELTGRENVRLSGAILGMTRKEIDRKFDEIVDFSGVETYIDTPVKRYSSGMRVRLGFAVAAHLEPEILLVDEVLAVGDAEFQKKCLGKMGDVAKEGRTVLFVSHNMAAVNRLCQRGILLDEGRVVLDAPIFDVTNRYLQADVGTMAERIWNDIHSAPGDDVARLRAVRVISSDGVVSDTIDIRYPVTIEIEYWNLKTNADLTAVLSFFNDQGTILFVSADWMEPEWGGRQRPAGLYRARCVVPGNLFTEGRVTVVAEVSTRYPTYEIHFLERDSVGFQVIDDGEPGSVRAGWGRNIPGVVRPMLQWENEYLGVKEKV